MGLHFLFCKMQVELLVHKLAACAQGEAVWGWTVTITNVTQDLPHAGAGCFTKLTLIPSDSGPGPSGCFNTEYSAEILHF